MAWKFDSEKRAKTCLRAHTAGQPLQPVASGLGEQAGSKFWATKAEANTQLSHFPSPGRGKSVWPVCAKRKEKKRKEKKKIVGDVYFWNQHSSFEHNFATTIWRVSSNDNSNDTNSQPFFPPFTLPSAAEAIGSTQVLAASPHSKRNY